MQKCTVSGFWIVNKGKYSHVMNSAFVNTSSFKYCMALMDFLDTELFCYFAVKIQNVLQNSSMVIECYNVTSINNWSNEDSSCMLMLNTIVRKPNYIFSMLSLNKCSGSLILNNKSASQPFPEIIHYSKNPLLIFIFQKVVARFIKGHFSSPGPFKIQDLLAKNLRCALPLWKGNSHAKG